jgi:trigger factor
MENFDVTEEELDAELKDMAEDYGLDVEKLKETISQREQALMKLDIMVQKALKLITESAVEVEPEKADKPDDADENDTNE